MATREEKKKKLVETLKRIMMQQDFHNWYQSDWDDFVTGDLFHAKEVDEKIDEFLAHKFRELL